MLVFVAPKLLLLNWISQKNEKIHLRIGAPEPPIDRSASFLARLEDFPSSFIRRVSFLSLVTSVLGCEQASLPNIC